MKSEVKYISYHPSYRIIFSFDACKYFFHLTFTKLILKSDCKVELVFHRKLKDERHIRLNR